MALYHKWDVKNDFVYVLQFFLLISDSLGSVTNMERPTKTRLGFLRNFQKPPFCTKTHWVKAKVLTMNLYGFSGEEGQILKQALI